MPSPFPGMDPYLEAHWRDVHTALIALTREILNQTLPPDLVARTEERVYVETEGAGTRQVTPDVRVVEHHGRGAPSAPAGPASAVAEPVVLRLQSEPVTERFIQIMEINGDRVVTAIEFVSPTNKMPGDGRRAYLAERSEFLDSDTNLVEVDLTRAGDWSGLLRPYVVPEPYRTPYRVSVRRSGKNDETELYPIPLRQRLPIVPIPLRPDEADLPLDLQSLLNRAYETGRYQTIDYSKLCQPPLDAEDGAWADELIRAAALR